LPKRPRAGGAGNDEAPPPRRLLIAANQADARETYVGLLRAAGFDSVDCELGAAVARAADTHGGVALLVGTGTDEGTAIKVVDDMRHSDHQQVRRTAALLLASSGRNRIYAWETGIDGFVVMPVHLDQIVGEIEAILTRPRLSRYDHRQAMIADARRH